MIQTLNNGEPRLRASADEAADWGKGGTEQGYLGELAPCLVMRFPTGVI